MDIHHIALREHASEWSIRQENEENSVSPLHSIEYPLECEKLAREEAAAMAVTQGFSSFVMSRFTDEAYMFQVSTVDAHTGETLEEHTEDYND